MESLLKCDALFRLLISATLFFSCYCSNLKLSDSGVTASFMPRNIRHYSFEGHPKDIYISWDPPLNYLLPKSPGLSMNTASAINGGHATSLNRLTLPLVDHSGSKSDNQYNVVDNKNVHGSANGSHTNLLEVNSTKKLTIKGDQKNEDHQRKNSLGIYDVYGLVDYYTISYRKKLDSEMKFIRVNGSHIWAVLQNLTAGTTYELYIRVGYSNKKEVSSANFIFSVPDNDLNSTSVCKCNSIGVNSGHEMCFSDFGIPCSCRLGYGGLFCESCIAQHYMDGDHCLPCPCNSKFGSFNCRFVSNSPVCNCRLGYAGKSCNKCSNGYFNYYRTCAKCICNNNIDPHSPEICDPEIGACKHCLYNTTGFACNVCSHGFIGDPILHKNCTKREFSKPKILSRRPKASFPLSLKIGLPLVILFICIVIGILFFHRRRFYRKLQPFWTIALKDDHDSVNLSQEFGGASSSGHTAPNHDDMDFYAKHQGGMQYSPLRETM